MGTLHLPIVLMIGLFATMASPPNTPGASTARTGALAACGVSIGKTPSATAGTKPAVGFDVEWGRRWWQMDATAEIACPIGPAAAYSIEIRALGFRADIRHDAAGFASDIALDARSSFAGNALRAVHFKI